MSTPIFDELAGQLPLPFKPTPFPRPTEPVAYTYSDPITDEAWPGISEVPDGEAPDRFPETWGGQPTPRDQAAIDAGNA